MDAPEDTDIDPDITDPQLLEYIKEQAVMWENLNQAGYFPGRGWWNLAI